jgi:hypothetical protein
MFLFTDEAAFTCHWKVNIRNVHYWAAEKPWCLQQAEHQHWWSTNIRCGVTRNIIIGPYFTDGNLNSERYIVFFKHPTPSSWRYTIEKSNEDVVPTWWLSSTLDLLILLISTIGDFVWRTLKRHCLPGCSITRKYSAMYFQAYGVTTDGFWIGIRFTEH